MDEHLLTMSPTDLQMHLFHEGTFYQSYHLFGAHLVKQNGMIGTRFCVWAPNAKEVRLVGTFNDWNGEKHKLTKINEQGVWMIVVPEI